ncbi:QacE family quaternary ammonium compound efflux SMR transporter [Vallitalea longa]|uniref:QacE family quaternary ammonium compound efflux SMR transporter n=1 Tax=Vallitalea longa TaxID=2936439 RepID=A0A9W5Y8J5_9FIRM|nr:quaternary ammonium compound efflux SMR transporter SugE [Vallitalea longa]GKX29167.1 QacE family quaternary ammonium compound efflux SMR transporter [Vallitalea longa]
MSWFYLTVAGVFEVIWATALKYSNGFTRLYPSIITVIGMIISFYLLSIATKTLPMGTAYAIWTGIGALGSIIVGILFFKEPCNLTRVFFLLLILLGIIGLKITSTSH